MRSSLLLRSISKSGKSNDKSFDILSSFKSKKPSKSKTKVLRNSPTVHHSHAVQRNLSVSQATVEELELSLESQKEQARLRKNEDFVLYNQKQQGTNVFRSLKSNNFFTPHQIPQRKAQADPVRREYAFVLIPSGVTVLQGHQPLKELTKPGELPPKVEERSQEMSKQGYLVLGRMGQLLVLERLVNPRQKGMQAARRQAVKYVVAVSGLTTLIYAGYFVTLIFR